MKPTKRQLEKRLEDLEESPNNRGFNVTIRHIRVDEHGDRDGVVDTTEVSYP